ncbi:hypothetical protein OPV22_027384 [Ensete ventricosum]|uniref:Uncharacterized protein n=1 Tax=Ensete ventricosum TaxID=4639 RepID=A0AAV8P597_ENSVE|nr:hypothetical protein OPV22_027384 [Ensete ventricosum]
MDSRGEEAGVNLADGRRPDIHELFCHYDALYFRNALGACALYWASSFPYPSAVVDCLYVDHQNVTLAKLVLEANKSVWLDSPSKDYIKQDKRRKSMIAKNNNLAKYLLPSVDASRSSARNSSSRDNSCKELILNN